jgi:hypothetical protein
MGFVYDLNCPTCGFCQENVAFGLTASCGSELSLAQDQETGALRPIETGLGEIEDHIGRRIYSDQELNDAMEAIVARKLRPKEQSISPGEAFCPECRGRLKAEGRGFM